MWTTGIFISEMFGVFVLTFMVLFVNLASKSSVLGLSDGGRRFFIAFGNGASLALAIIVALGIANATSSQSLGYVNPAVAIADAIAKINYSYLLPSLLGELIGAILGSGLTLGIFMAAFSKSPVALADAKETFSLLSKDTPAARTVFTEMLASFIFIGIIIAVIFSQQNIGWIGLAFTLVLLTFGLRFDLILNGFVALAPMAWGLLIKMPSPNELKYGFKNASTGLITNLSVGAIIGSIYLAL